MQEVISKKHLSYLTLVIVFTIFCFWWALGFLFKIELSYGLVSYPNLYFLTALLGGVLGLRSSARWGMLKSHLGSAITFFSLGLLAQVFGQLSYSYLTFIQGVDIPYPSIGDIGYFGSIPLYILGVINLMKVLSLHTIPLTTGKKILSVIIPLILFGICFFVFLKNRTFSIDEPLRSFLDYGYPLFQTLYISLALVTYLLSIGLLGGVLRSRSLLLLFALVAQFVADFTFLYRADRGLVYPGGPTDFLYLFAYFIMSLAIVDFGIIFEKIKNGGRTNDGGAVI